MKGRRHFAYLKYVMRHKWFVFVAGLRLGPPTTHQWPLWILTLILHDWDKFLGDEWLAYARTFYAPDGSKQYDESPAFADAWNLHQKRNKHHWQYWLVYDTITVNRANNNGTYCTCQQDQNVKRISFVKNVVLNVQETIFSMGDWFVISVKNITQNTTDKRCEDKITNQEQKNKKLKSENQLENDRKYLTIESDEKFSNITAEIRQAALAVVNLSMNFWRLITSLAAEQNIEWKSLKQQQLQKDLEEQKHIAGRSEITSLLFSESSVTTATVPMDTMGTVPIKETKIIVWDRGEGQCLVCNKIVLPKKILAQAMPLYYLHEMLADWMGAGRAITGNPDPAATLAWYNQNKNKMILHPTTRTRLEELLHAQINHTSQDDQSLQL